MDATSCAARTTTALLLAAEYARRQGLYDRAINTAERTSTRHDFALRYLMPFREQFAAAAREQAVDEALLFGLARQESRFVPDIVSVGRRGRADAADAADRALGREADWAAPTTAPSQIADVGINTQFGAFYFKYWLDRLDAPCRRSRPLRTMRVPAARRRGAPARRSRARSGSRRFRSTRPATT